MQAIRASPKQNWTQPVPAPRSNISMGWEDVTASMILLEKWEINTLIRRAWYHKEYARGVVILS